MEKFLCIVSCIVLLQSVSFAEDVATDVKPVNSDTAPITTESKPAAKPFSVTSDEPVFYTAAQQERDVKVFSEKNLFGLKDQEGNIIAPAIYKKIVMMGRSGWIVQRKSKFGLMDSKGNLLLPLKYRHADRILGRYLKIGNDSDFGIYNEYGEEIIPPIYNSIDLLFGKMFLTYKNFRYGISDFSGNVLIPNICDDIYLPAKDTIKIKYLGSWYELNDVTPEKLAAPDVLSQMDKTTSFKVGDIVTDTGVISGYSLLTVSDYFLKVFSSISPAHEEAIDDLILSHGVDTVDILKKFTWVPKYPVTFAKKYYIHIRNPFNGPLSDIRYGLKHRL